jgi:hypothetical protein
MELVMGPAGRYWFHGVSVRQFLAVGAGPKLLVCQPHAQTTDNSVRDLLPWGPLSSLFLIWASCRGRLRVGVPQCGRSLLNSPSPEKEVLDRLVDDEAAFADLDRLKLPVPDQSPDSCISEPGDLPGDGNRDGDGLQAVPCRARVIQCSFPLRHEFKRMQRNVRDV